MSVLGARLRSGIELVMEMVDLRQALAPADLVITGEGALDGQTLHGKAPAGVAAAARTAGIPVVAVCGSNALTGDELHQAGILRAYQLCDLEPNRQRSMRDAAALLQRLGERIAVEHLAARTHSLQPQRTGHWETP
jgi:glycerate kinase